MQFVAAPELHSCALEPFEVPGLVVNVSHAHLHVDDRLGGEALHRGGPHVLDSAGDVSEFAADSLSPLLKLGRPPT
jgi:hypothetical protein